MSGIFGVCVWNSPLSIEWLLKLRYKSYFVWVRTNTRNRRLIRIKNQYLVWFTNILITIDDKTESTDISSSFEAFGDHSLCQLDNGCRSIKFKLNTFQLFIVSTIIDWTACRSWKLIRCDLNLQEGSISLDLLVNWKISPVWSII